MTLKDQGFRFVFRDGKYDWTHPAEVLASDIDCTDMSDEEFEMFVHEHTPAPSPKSE